MNPKTYRNALKTLFAVGVAGLMAGALAPRAEAQYSVGRTVEITPFVGYYVASDLWGLQTSLSLENSFMWGGRLTVNPNSRGGVEFAYTRASSEIGAPSFYGYASQQIGDLTIDSYDLNFIGYQPTGNPKVTPFASLGFGWSTVHREIAIPEINATNNGSATLFNFNFALGAKVNVNEKAGLRLEGRWRTTETGVQTGAYYWCDIYGNCYSYGTSWYNSWELVAGIVLKTGG